MLLKNLLYRYKLYRANSYNQSEVYRKYLDVKIGENVRFTGKRISFGSEPYLVEIGNNVTITSGVIFETHDGGVGVFRKEFPNINIFGKIKIGNNVFIGHRVIIMPGIIVGDNVVIGAGSIVTKDVPNNVVIAGVPAKTIKSIEDYKNQALKKSTFIIGGEFENRKSEILAKINQ
jgi:acetyltransferase-like isoleucine patch superfamily enzyme